MSFVQRVLQSRALLPLCLVIGAALSVLHGQDASWDLQNYHLYNAWALLHDRTGRDLTAAGMQSFFNPLLDLPYYLLGSGLLEHWPRTLAAMQGLWYGLLLFLLATIAVRLARLQGRTPGWPELIAVVIGASGTMAVSQAGLSSNEVLLACLVLAGLLQLTALYDPTTRQAWRAALLGGLCCGLAVGLKPTAVVYPPAMALALILSLRPRADALRLVALYVAGCALAFAISYGWWGWHLYRLTGNPIFPLFNQVFQSDWTGAASGTDLRFRPRNSVQWLFYPFYWLGKNQSLVTELSFADPRYALAVLALLVLAWHGLFRGSIGKPSTASHGSLLALLAWFATIAYVLWLILFAILRYAVPLEALSGVFVLSAVYVLAELCADPVLRGRTVVSTMAVLLLPLAACTRYPDWGHARYATSAFEIHPATVEPGSMVVFVGMPTAYLAAFFPHAENLEFVGLSWFTGSARGHRLWDMTRTRITMHQGPLYMVRRNDAGNEEKLLEEFLPGHRETDCRTIASAIERDTRGHDTSSGLRQCRIELR